MRGCTLLKKPSYYRMNPVAMFGVKVFMKNSYHKLIGIT